MTLTDVRVTNLVTGAVWVTHDIAEVCGARIVVIVHPSHRPALVFFAPAETYAIDALDAAGAPYRSPVLTLDVAESEEDVEFIFCVGDAEVM